LLYGALLRKNGQKEEALAQINRLIEFDPLNYAAYFEKGLIQGKDLLSDYIDFMSDPENIYLDIVVQYVNAGMYEEGIKVLTSLDHPKSPLVHFYLAWLYNETEQDSKAQEMLAITRGISTEYCFPFRSESEMILRYAIKSDPKNAVANYLMGNLMYDNRKEDAIVAWEKAAEIDPGFSMIWRNLAFAAFHYQKDAEKAIDHITRALDGDKEQPLWYDELAKYYDASSRDFRECLALLEENIDVVKIDAGAPKEMVKLLNLAGEYDKAIDMLETHHFRTWEGGRVIHSYYVDSHVLRAMDRIREGKYVQALEDLDAALLYPSNLEVGKPSNDGRGAQVWYTMGQAYEKSGKKKKANALYEKAAHTDNAPSELKYYQAMSLLKLGENQEADALFNQLIDQGNELIQRGTSVSGIGIDEALSANQIMSDAYYLQALGKMGLNKEAEAKALLEKSLEAYRNNLWSKVMLAN
jgi:tetratricopeptide (TPR) repeat protein